MAKIGDCEFVVKISGIDELKKELDDLEKFVAEKMESFGRLEKKIISMRAQMDGIKCQD